MNADAVNFSTVEVVTTRCPACRNNVHDRRHILTYRRIYLCATDRATWDAADQQDRLRGRGGR